MKNRINRVLFSLCIAATLPALGCSDATEPHAQDAQVGSVRFPLISTGDDAQQYRLSAASFEIVGPESITLSGDIDEAVVSAELLEGEYTVTLLDGWVIEVEDGEGGWIAVDAVLTQSPTAGIVINDGQITEVTFVFGVGDDFISFGHGQLDIGFSVITELPTPPVVVSISPTQGEAGVLADTPIVITFSEAMDTASVQAALSVSGVMGASFVWAGGNTELTVTPDAPLSYAAGEDAATTEPLEYVVNLATTATDADGDSMAAAFTSDFTTLRRIADTIDPVGVAHYNTYAPAVGEDITICTDTDDEQWIGWWSAQISGGQRYGYIAYDLTELDVSYSEMTALESVSFEAQQAAPDPGFYPSGVRLDRLNYGPLTNDALNYPISQTLGILVNDADPNPVSDITSSVASQFGAGTTDFLYRLSHNGSPNGDYAYFPCNGFSLVATYLVP